MPVKFHKDMDKYLSNKRKKKLVLSLTSRIRNKRAGMLNKTSLKVKGVKERLVAMKKKKEKPVKIDQGEIDRLIGEKRIKSREQVDSKVEGGWKEVKVGDIRKGEDLQEIERKNIKKEELSEEIRILKEKQMIEEERLDRLRKSRRGEQMSVLKDKVKNILFKKKPKLKVAEEIKQEAVEEVKRDKDVEEMKDKVVEALKEGDRLKEKIAHKKGFRKPKEDVVKEKPKKKINFRQLFSFIEIKTAEQIAKGEEEKRRAEEKRAIEDSMKVSQMLSQGEEAKVNFSTLFPEEMQQASSEIQENKEDVIELDQGYKIRVVRNS